MENQNLLYTGTSFEYGMVQLQNNEIKPTVVHRYWTDSILRTHDEPGYESKCYWLQGLSTSRSLKVASSFGGLVWEINRDIIKTKYKIKCKDWGSTIPNREIKNRGKEQEEFIVYRRMKHKRGKSWIKEKEHVNSIQNWLKYVNGFYISLRHNLGIESLSDAEFTYLTEHPLFLGYSNK